jgi:putative FmdB family regulatory protein
MPIYEFYCPDCHTIFNFFSRHVNTTAEPKCPKCKNRILTRKISLFSVTGRASDDTAMDDLPINEDKMEKAMEVLSRQADKIDENDPRQAANLMRQLSDMTGLELNAGMQEALNRMEKGDDPEKVEAEMGDLLETEDPFILPGKKGKRGISVRMEPSRDDTLYEL